MACCSCGRHENFAGHLLETNSVHLLPYFDVYLLAHGFKEHFLKPQFYKRVYRNQGSISPVVLINGEIAGVWSTSCREKLLR